MTLVTKYLHVSKSVYSPHLSHLSTIFENCFLLLQTFSSLGFKAPQSLLIFLILLWTLLFGRHTSRFSSSQPLTCRGLWFQSSDLFSTCTQSYVISSSLMTLNTVCIITTPKFKASPGSPLKFQLTYPIAYSSSPFEYSVDISNLKYPYQNSNFSLITCSSCNFLYLSKSQLHSSRYSVRKFVQLPWIATFISIPHPTNSYILWATSPNYIRTQAPSHQFQGYHPSPSHHHPLYNCNSLQILNSTLVHV